MPGRELTIKKYNLDLYDPFETDGPFEMPVIKKTLHIPKELIGFNEAISSKNYQSGIHMFIDDYQFERIWNTPERYVNVLKQYDCVLTPDFSLYMDMPRAMKVWNIYRSRLIGQYLQSQGICVIPTVSWAERETYTFCFDGIETGGVVAISTIGCIKDEYARSIWKDGVDYMIDKLKPTAILIYGQSIEHDFKGTKVIYYKNKVIERARKHGR